MSAADLFAAPALPTGHGIRVGIGGWVFPAWRNGAFYPAGLVQRRELEYASRQLATIEINGTYYGAQKPATYAKWRDDNPPGFVFSVKAPKRIVQSRTLARSGGQIDDFIAGIAELGDRLGPLLWQFDAAQRRDVEEFDAFLALLPARVGDRALRHVVELRDPAFVDARLLDRCRAHGVATVFTDSPDYPSFADVTGGFVYARLMRSQAGLATGYAGDALARWADRARRWAAGGEPDDLPRIAPARASAKTPAKREVFVYFISAAKARNPVAAMTLQAMLAAD